MSSTPFGRIGFVFALIFFMCVGLVFTTPHIPIKVLAGLLIFLISVIGALSFSRASEVELMWRNFATALFIATFMGGGSEMGTVEMTLEPLVSMSVFFVLFVGYNALAFAVRWEEACEQADRERAAAKRNCN